MFQKAVKLNPSVVKKILGIGYAYFKQSNFDKAIETYNKIIDVNKKNTNIRWYIYVYIPKVYFGQE